MSAAVGESKATGGSVLVVDDERGPRESLRLILAYHFRVLTAASGEEAVETLRREPIDVVTLDLKMPGLSGPETLGAMKIVDPDVEVVIVTGYGSFESAVEVMRLRAFDYITKPFDARSIVEVVRRATERRRLARIHAGDPLAATRLDELVEDAELLQESAAGRLSDIDRGALLRIRRRLSALRNQARALGAGGGSGEPRRSEKGRV